MGINNAPEPPEDPNILRQKILDRHAEKAPAEEIADMLDHYIAIGTREANRMETTEARLNFELELLELRIKLDQVGKKEIIEDLRYLKMLAIQEGLSVLAEGIKSKIDNIKKPE